MLTKASQSDFPALYSLLRQSFPQDEYRPYEAQEALLSNPLYTLYMTQDQSALISIWQFKSFAFIEHFAVSPKLRSHGLGTLLLNQVLSQLPCPVILEAELPDTPEAIRRLHFYQRNGFTVTDYDYTQPSYAPGRNPVPMKLLSTKSTITLTELDHISHTLYRHVYNKEGRS